MVASATSSFPGLIDAPQAPTQFDNLATPNVEHDLLHDWAQDAIKKIEAKLGITSSPDVTSVDYVLRNHQHQGTDRSAQIASLPIKMVASQSQNPLEVRNSTAALLSAITPAGEFLDVGASATTLAFRSYVAGDTADRYNVQADGKMSWGAGASTPDLSAYRDVANRLFVAGSLYVAPQATVQPALSIARYSAASNNAMVRIYDEVPNKTFEIQSDGSFWAGGDSSYFGAYATYATGVRGRLYTSTSDVGLFPESDATIPNVNLRLRSKGTGLITFQTGAGVSTSYIDPTTGTFKINNAPGYLDLVTAAASGGAGNGSGSSNIGDKIALYSQYGFGIQTGRMVAYLSSSAALGIRPYSATGAASSGTDGISLYANGIINASGTDQYFGPNAYGGTGNRLHIIGGANGSGSTILAAEGTDANVAMVMRGKGAGSLIWTDPAGAGTLWAITSNGATQATGADHFFGANALSGTGTRIHLGSLADPNNAYVLAEGSGANVGLIMKAKGTGAVWLQNVGGSGVFSMAADGKLSTTQAAGYFVTSAVAGGANALPAAPVGYWVFNINGTDRKIPYYA